MEIYPSNKIFIEQPSSEPKVKVFIPMYEPVGAAKCQKLQAFAIQSKILPQFIRIGAEEYSIEKLSMERVSWRLLNICRMADMLS
jgi:hypothetical protein